MILFPAIDLKGGECVRLKLGDMDQATVYNTDPGAQAKAFEDQGFQYLDSKHFPCSIEVSNLF